MVVFAALGLLTADKLEELFPARNNKAIRPGSSSASTTTASGAKFIENPSDASSEAETEAKKPKLFSVSVVDRT